MIGETTPRYRSVAVTGGNGGLGRVIVETLGERTAVTPLDVKPGVAGGEWRRADVTSPESLEAALRGHDAVVHTAALLLPDDPEDLMFRVNVVGTWNVLRAARKLGIVKVVLISSETVSGIISITRVAAAKPEFLPIDEAHPLRPRETYAMSKQLCEVTAESFSRTGDMQVVVLRPTLILMPGREGYVRETRAIDDPDLWSYVVVQDVAAAAALALELDHGPFNVFYLSAADTFSPEPTLAFMERRFGPFGEIRRPEIYAANPHAAIWDPTRAAEVLGFVPRYDWRRFLEEEGQGAAPC